VLSSITYFVSQKNIQGFCWSAGKVLSDEELIQAFVGSMSKRDLMDRVRAVDADARRRFSSGDEYLDNVPDCCSVLKTRGQLQDFDGILYALPPKTWNKATGQAYTMMASVAAGYVLEGGSPKVIIQRKTADGQPMYFLDWVSSCGQLIKIPDNFFIG